MFTKTLPGIKTSLKNNVKQALKHADTRSYNSFSVNRNSKLVYPGLLEQSGKPGLSRLPGFSIATALIGKVRDGNEISIPVGVDESAEILFWG